MFKVTSLAPAIARYANPVVHGDFPDPSVIRVGARDFYAVTTSTEWAPYFPILHSTDLVSWTNVGAVFTSRPAWAVGQFWAPEISYRDGRYYIYYTARRQHGPLSIAVATAAHPTGPWTDHGPLVGQRAGSIDATTAIENGRPWLIWKEDGNAVGQPTTLWVQALSADGCRLEGERRMIMRNDQVWEDAIVEAPCVVERDGWYVLLYSGNKCCGEACRYAVGVARARSITGPWFKHPRNPILTENAAFRGPGHGSCVSTVDGRMFYLYHAYQNARGATSLGRQLMLDEIEWDVDGWPSINGGRGPSLGGRAPFGHRAADPDRAPFSTDFRRPLDANWQWPQHVDWPVEHRRDRGELIVRAARHRGRPMSGVFGRPARSLDYTATAVVSIAGTDPGVLASLAAYGNGANALGVGVRDGRIIAWSLRDDVWSESDLGRAPAGKCVHLRLDAVWGKAYWITFGDGRRWSKHVEVLDGTHLPPWDRGVRVALCASGSTGTHATFMRLRIVDVPATLHRLSNHRRATDDRPAATHLPRKAARR